MSRWPVRTEKERFLAKVQQDNNDCWLWQGYIRYDGYGQFNPAAGEVELAHRASYRLHTGTLLLKECLLHSCDVKSCVNPAHLRKGTQADNIRDSQQKGRFTGRPATMSQEDYVAVKQLINEKQINGRKITLQMIADKFNISIAQVSKIKLGKIKNAISS